MTANNAETLVEGALQGIGLAHLPTWLCSEYLISGQLLPLFCENGLPEPEPGVIHALRLQRGTHPRSERLLAFLLKRFGFPPPGTRHWRKRCSRINHRAKLMRNYLFASSAQPGARHDQARPDLRSPQAG